MRRYTQKLRRILDNPEYSWKKATAQRIYFERQIGEFPPVSVIILTHNALHHVRVTLESLSKYRPNNFEVVVVDNSSTQETVDFLRKCESEGKIDKLFCSQSNLFFAAGNNAGVSIASQLSEYFLLLNSDIEILHPDWFKIMASLTKKRCVVACGVSRFPVVRPDGWCFLIDRRSYLENGGINEFYQMNYGITELTAKLLKQGIEVSAILDPEKYILHFGQRSYSPEIRKTNFNSMTDDQVVKLFRGTKMQFYRV